MSAKIVSLDQKNQIVKVAATEITNEFVFAYFDKLPEEERDEAILRAVQIGTLALSEDRISAFLAKTDDELGVRLEHLKRMFEFKKELFYRTAEKGTLAESEVASLLNDYFGGRGWADRATETGSTTGALKKNKTGDIICAIDGEDGPKIVIEVKFDKSYGLDDILVRDAFKKKQESAWNQLLEARVNREAKVSIIVFDRALVSGPLAKEVEHVAWIPEVGFVAIVDLQSRNIDNLVIAYNLARDIALHARPERPDEKVLAILVKRIVNSLKSALGVEKLVRANIENSKQILTELQKSLLLMELTQKFLLSYLAGGTLTHAELFELYMAEDARDRFKVIASEIEKIGEESTGDAKA